MQDRQADQQDPERIFKRGRKNDLDSLLRDWITTDSWELGKGSYGKVYLVKNGLNKFLSLKESEPQPSYSDYMIGCTFDILREINTLNTVQDPHIIRLVQANVSYERLLLPLNSSSGKPSKDPKDPKDPKDHKDLVNPYCYILMESGEENAVQWRNKILLKQGDRSVGQELLRSCFHLFLAVRALHTQKLIHNDVKPENLIRIATSHGNIFKLSDFGLSMPPDGYKWKNGRMFAIGYRAPELLLNSNRAHFSYASDIWAAGISMCLLLFGSVQKDKKDVTSTHPPFPFGDCILDLFQDMVQLLGLPTEVWKTTYIRSSIKGFKEMYQDCLTKGHPVNVNQEQRVIRFLKRLTDVYGNTQLDLLVSSLGGTQTFLQVLDLLAKCIQYDPVLRPNVLECLNHPCFHFIREQGREKQDLLMTPQLKHFFQHDPRDRDPRDQKNQTPALKDLNWWKDPRLITKAQLQMKFLRKFTFEKISKVLEKFHEQRIYEKDEIAAIMSCALNLFDRDLVNFFARPLSKETLEPEIMCLIIAFAVASTWLAGKFLSIMIKDSCLTIANQFQNHCQVNQILHIEAQIVNQEGFTFPQSYLQTQFSISADLFQVLNLNLDSQQEVADEMFSTLLKRATRQ